ncbi:uncharacterized protein BYT42DRAFT_609369 [Radiomyces spectabilis]|uniref:uncharacterized protein n=1 Tax=Radiomyces spectabilis TaxID=64574 RepID=UPI00221F3892|nr:uncharacterized protein BYT42DRAFT_609369 [Radiomyces spectabilis]KAI8393586.1 hypothetical protein BYT42DRAFT_609369 [Radiomyces spectabilis]
MDVFAGFFAMLNRIKRNIYPVLAVITLPVGYYVGIQLRENADKKALLQQANEAQLEYLQKQRMQMLEEDKVVRQKIEQLKQEREAAEAREARRKEYFGK